MFALFLVALYYGAVDSLQDIKTWNSDNNFDNPRNWPKGHVPCSKDRVIFPSGAQVTIFVPNSASFSEMVLPIRSEFIFEEGANLLGKGLYTESECVGTDVNFQIHIDSWFDPRKWNISSSHSFPIETTSITNYAIPHAFRIPCEKDYVVFPRDKTFAVSLEEIPVIIGGIEINGMSFPNELFQAFLTSREGYLLLQKTRRIQISGTTCRDVTGCGCGNDEPKILAKICSFVTCPKLECSDPVKPNGHCCPICGSYLLMEYEADFEFGRIGNVFKSYISKAKYLDIQWFVSKTKDDFILAVFVDGGSYKGDANDFAQSIHRQLKEDIRTENLNRLKSVKIFSSTAWYSGIPIHSSSTGQGLSGGGTAAILIVIFICCGSAAWYVYKRRRIPGFSFVRFDFHSSKIELELGTTPHDELSPEQEPTSPHVEISKAFDNPVYGTVPEGSEIKEKNDGKSANGEDENIIENPMFMVFESSKDDELISST